MAYYDEDRVFVDLAIRSTAAQNSTESISGEFDAKTIIVESTLNQTASCQLQGSRNSVWYNVGSAFDVAASTNVYQTVSDYFPKYRIQATCSVAPASGVLNAWVLKAGAI